MVKNLLRFGILTAGAFVLFLLLRCLWYPFFYFSILCLLLMFLDISLINAFRFAELRNKIERGYKIYLAEMFQKRLISEEKYLNEDKEFFKEYNNMFKKDYLLSIFAILVPIILFVVVIYYVFLYLI